MKCHFILVTAFFANIILASPVENTSRVHLGLKPQEHEPLKFDASKYDYKTEKETLLSEIAELREQIATQSNYIELLEKFQFKQNDK